ncbi:MAG: Secretory protein of YscJ/FliF family, partial [Pseudomonadota bacterium]
NLFRSDRTNGKAAVAIRTESGARPSEAMVLGIQQLISASVPDLSPESVVVLNSRGEAVSVLAAAPAIVDGAIGIGQVSNELAIAMRDAIARIAPGLNHELRAETLPSGDPATTPKAETIVTVRLRSSEELSADQRMQATAAVNQVAQEAGFKGGDLLFVTTPLSNPAVILADEFAPKPPAPAVSAEPKSLAPTQPETVLDWLMTPAGKIVTISVLGLLLIGLVALAWWRRTEPGISRMESQEDAEAARELRQALARQQNTTYGLGQRPRDLGAGNGP